MPESADQTKFLWEVRVEAQSENQRYVTYRKASLTRQSIRWSLLCSTKYSLIEHNLLC